MRIVFMGASKLGWDCCRTLFEAGQRVVGIFTIPREFRISWSPSPVSNVQFKGFEDLAAAHRVPLVHVTRKMSDPEYAGALGAMRPDLIVVVGWYYMLPRSLRSIAPLGAVGVHASLLPKYRGGAPLVWAVINGEKRTGVSLFHFADGVDDGDLIAQSAFEIAREDDIAAVLDKASRASLALVREYVPLLGGGGAPRFPQDHSRATSVPQRRPEDGLIDWRTKSAEQVYDWVRAQTRPYPGAFTFFGGEKVTIWRAGLGGGSAAAAAAPPGSIAGVSGEGGSISVRCADGRAVEIHEVGLADGTAVSGAQFARARGAGAGAAFAPAASPAAAVGPAAES